MHEASIGVDAWIIQDGNYGDFAVGDRCRFALEFSGPDLRASGSNRPTASYLEECRYRVAAQVIFVDTNVWVIDFGLRAFWESKPPEFVTVGSWVEGDIFLGIDPFFYKEYLHEIRGMPSLTYEWELKGITRDDTPWLVADNGTGGKVLSRDKERERWTKVERTDAWEDDEGRSSYALHAQVRDA